jgi:hypothetical protein
MGGRREARISFRRSGGLFAGDRLETTVDLDELPEEEADGLERELSRVDLDELARGSPLRGQGADAYQYDLAVERRGETREVTVDETALPDELRPLVDRLTRRAARERRERRR